MRRIGRYFLFALTAAIAFPPHAECQDRVNEKAAPLPVNALARIGTTRYQVSHYQRALLLAPDGTRLVVVNPLDGIDVWRLPAWTKEHTIRIDHIDPDIEARFACAAFTPDSKKLLIFNASTEQVVVFDLAAGKAVKRIALPVDGPFHDALIVAANDRKSFVFTWDDPSTLKQSFLAYDFEKGQVKFARSFDLNGPLKKLLFSADGNKLAAVDEKNFVRNFDLKNSKERPNVENWGTGPLASSSDGKSLYLSKTDGTVLHCDSADFTVRASHASSKPYAIRQLGLTSDGKVIALGIRETTVFLWDVATGKLLSPTDVPSGAVTHLAFSAQGELFIAAENGHAAWWNPRTAVKVRDVKLNRPSPEEASARQISPDGRWLAVNENKERILISRADGRGGREPVAVRMDDREISAFLFSPDGRQLACASLRVFPRPPENRILIYEMSSKKIRLELPGHPSGSIERLAYATDSGLLASAATDALVHVWQAGLRAHVQILSNRHPTAENLNDWYITMAGSDASTAFQSMVKLAEVPTQAVKLFADRIPPARKLDTEGRTITQWIGDLGSGNFGIRAKANAMLLKLGPSAERELRAVLRNRPDLEAKRRIEELLDRIAAAGDFTPTDILHGRTVEVLEAIGTPEARAVLTRWAEGDPGAVLTVEARQALTHLQRLVKGK